MHILRVKLLDFPYSGLGIIPQRFRIKHFCASQKVLTFAAENKSSWIMN